MAPLLALGRAGWAFVGVVLAVVLAATLLATVSSVVLPLAFAAVLAVIFRPLAARMEQHRVPPPLAAGTVVLLLLAVAGAVVWMTVHGLLTQTSDLLDQFDAALSELDIDSADIARARAAVEQLSPAVTSGFARIAVSGVSSLGGFITGSILSVLIMYYLVKDAHLLRDRVGSRMSVVHHAQFELFVTDACFVLRRYWLGRTIVSAVVASVVGLAAALLGLPLVLTITAVTFIGGYIPYIGAIIGGLLAVVIAVGSNGIGAGIAMLIVVLVANLLIENLVEPAITGRTLDIHPLMVLLVTALGGIIGGLVGLVMAVPITVIASRAVDHARRVTNVDAQAIRDSVERAAGLDNRAG